MANGLPVWAGEQVAVDTTLVSPLHRSGAPRPRAAAEAGVALRAARQRKESTYPKLLAARRCRLVVLALEVGGRWSPEAARFVRLLARAKARSAPAPLRAAVRQAWGPRWASLLAFAAQRALAASLLELPLGDAAGPDGPAPDPEAPLYANYSEGLFVGYRYYDKHGIEPAFAFVK